MAEVTVEDVVFALKQLGVDVGFALLRRIEWSLSSGNHNWPEDRLKEELSGFALRSSRSKNLSASGVSLNDFLCEKGISFAQYRQFIQSVSASSIRRSFLTTDMLERFDIDSEVLTYRQNHSASPIMLDKLRELGLSHVQCRVILGLGIKSYERLKKQIQEQRKEEINRTGRSENDAWSFAKHTISELCLRRFKDLNGRSPFILETHQGIGDATTIYRNHGYVLGFDNHKEAHQLLIDRAKTGGFYRNARDLYLQYSSFDLRTAGQDVFLTEEAVPCEQGLQTLIKQGLHFDAVDIDPWTTSKPHFSDALNVLSDFGLVMVTLGDQHPWPKGETQAWERFDVESYNIVLAEGVKQIWRRTWMFLRRACAWYMNASIAHSFCLLPIVVMRNFEPWASREDFPNGVMGIDRIYFLAKRVFDMKRLDQVFQSWTEPLPFFDEAMLREQILSYTEPSDILNFISFIDEIWPAMKPFWPRYSEWLTETSNNLSSRWRCSEPSEVGEARNHLREAIQQACEEKLVKGFQLADGWLRKL